LHLLRRVGFAATAAEVRHFAGRSPQDAVDELLAVRPALPPRPAFADDPNPNQGHIDGQIWWVERMLAARWVRRGADTPSPLVEKLTLFWHSHFACGLNKVYDIGAMFDQNQAFRRLATAGFEELVTAAAFSGAMLRYIDNESNVKDRPNENFARELMELHTMGVGNYTEADVKAMARAWTGHGIVGWTGSGWDLRYRFHRRQHDAGAKTLWGVTRNWDAPDTITELVLGSRRAITARFITRKLWRYFVNGTPPDGAVGEVAATFAAGGMRIDALVRALLLRPEFWAPESRWAIVRQPAEFAVDALRASGVPPRTVGLHRYLPQMGQFLFEPPNVAGWGTHQYWISTGATWGKVNFLRDLSFLPETPQTFAALEGMATRRAVTFILRRMGLFGASRQTRTMVAGWHRHTLANYPWILSRNAVMAAGLAPEFQLS
jgi:uncharacterized protein (DUF1800 family)